MCHKPAVQHPVINRMNPLPTASPNRHLSLSLCLMQSPWCCICLLMPTSISRPSGPKQSCVHVCNARLAGCACGVVCGVGEAPGDDAAAATPEPEGPPVNSTILYLCNLTWWTTDAEVEALVTQYGELEQQVGLAGAVWGAGAAGIAVEAVPLRMCVYCEGAMGRC